ncbi:MAG: hypothetical protein M9926_12165 [Lentimicrobium sp.]|uniref:hypothetical protein n=1 Tax=Lentimicrobium sp. TaxID=2034841 RepID=UPI0025F89705|nr:hypothetical protein [Lentimicrobium sp.]MCO5257499.1 hypothetical protein [Lentimicrobium sp.]
MTSFDTVIITGILISILLFFVLREVFCWYLKINKKIKLQQAMLETLLKMYERDGGDVNWEIVNKTLLK